MTRKMGSRFMNLHVKRPRLLTKLSCLKKGIRSYTQKSRASVVCTLQISIDEAKHALIFKRIKIHKVDTPMKNGA